MCCLANNGKLDHYWLDSGETGLIDSVLLSNNIQENLQPLISGERIFSLIVKLINFEVTQDSAGLYSLLLFSGYLQPAAVVSETHRIYRLSIPNYEVAYIYEQRLLDWVSKQLQIDSSNYYSLINPLVAGQVGDFGERLQALLHRSTSFHQTGGKVVELFYSGFMLGLLRSLSDYYLIESERESGRGRPDAVLIPKAAHGDQALVIEYKVGQDVADLPALAAEGLSQISAKGYSAQAKSHAHVKKLLQVCLAFCGKEVALKYDQVTL